LKASFTAKKVVKINVLNDSTRWIELEGSLEASPGQFVMVWLPEVGEKPYSVASMDPFSLLVVDVGPFSHNMHCLNIGDQVWIKGPLGHGFVLEGRELLIAAGGYGAAPLYPLAGLARAQGCNIHVCLGARSAAGVLLEESFKQLGCEVSLATEDGSKGIHGLVTQSVHAALQEKHFDTLYACGPVGMLSALADSCHLQRLNYQLSWEANMRCGTGLCGSCEVPVSFDASLPKGWLACFDGPVFIKHWE